MNNDEVGGNEVTSSPLGLIISHFRQSPEAAVRGPGWAALWESRP